MGRGITKIRLQRLYTSYWGMEGQRNTSERTNDLGEGALMETPVTFFERQMGP